MGRSKGRIMYSVGAEWGRVREGDNVLCRGGMGRR